MFCKYCGASNPNDASFCSGCGKALTGARSDAPLQREKPQITNTNVAPTHTPPSPQRKGSGKVWIAVGVVAVIVIAIVEFNHLLGRSELQDKQAALSNRVAQHQAALASLQDTLSKQTAGLEEYKASVEGYMLDHKAIVAALAAVGAGGGIALDRTNSFSDDAKTLGETVGGVGLVYCVFNASECSSVLGELNKADAHRKTLETEIASTQSAIARENSALLEDQNSLQAVQQQLAQ